MTPEDRYAGLVEALDGTPGVTYRASEPGKFGADALKVDNKIFAMLVRGRLVVKLPAKRVSELIASGEGDVFDANKGKPMKEWVTLTRESDTTWLALATEALEFGRAAAGG